MGTKEHFLSAWNAIPEEERFAPQFVVHRVRFGESLWTISKKYNVSIHDLAAVNKIRNRNKVRVGQKLNVPLKGGKFGVIMIMVDLPVIQKGFIRLSGRYVGANR